MFKMGGRGQASRQMGWMMSERSSLRTRFNPKILYYLGSNILLLFPLP